MEKPKIIKELLNLREKITNCKEMIEYCDRMSISIGGQSFDNEVVDHTRNLEAPFVKWIYKRMECEAKLKNLEDQYKILENKLSEYIVSFEKIDEIQIITLRYLKWLDWPDIQDELCISESTMYRLHRRALTKLFEVEKMTVA